MNTPSLRIPGPVQAAIITIAWHLRERKMLEASISDDNGITFHTVPTEIQLEAARQTIATLRQMLRTHGQHLVGCGIWHGSNCSCGLSAATRREES